MTNLLGKLRLKIFIKLTLVYAVIAVAGAALFKWAFPEQWFGSYPWIVAFYWVLGMALNHVLGHTRFSHPERMINVFMIFRAAKLMTTIIFLMITIHYMGDKKVAFAISMMVNYITFTVMELYIYYLYNKRALKNMHGGHHH